MMSAEEKMPQDDPPYDGIKQFWYKLSGDIEFSLNDGTHYRLKATTLPNSRGTIVTAQNITEYIKKINELKAMLKEKRTA